MPLEEYGSGVLREIKIGDRVLYIFNTDTRMLNVSISPGNLEILLREIGEIPDKGKDLIMPEIDGHYIFFSKVRKIEVISGLSDEDCLLKPKSIVEPQT
jgi:hypothetical protein